MTIDKLLDRIIGNSLLYVQTGDPKHYAIVQKARAEIEGYGTESAFQGGVRHGKKQALKT